MGSIEKITRFMPGEIISWEQLQYHVSRYSFLVPFIEDKVVLDVACGIGYGSNYLGSKSGRMVIGGDISRPAIAYAQNHYKRAEVEFVLLDARNLPFTDDSFDAIVSIETIEHIKEWEDFLNECRRVLKDGGIFICSTPNREVISPGLMKPLHRPHVQEFSVSEFRSLLNSYFEDIVIYGIGVQSKKRITMRKLKLKVESVLGSQWIISFIDNLLNLALRPLPQFRGMKVDAIKGLDYERFLHERYKPRLLQDTSSSLCAHTIGVSKMRKRVEE